MTVTEVHQSLGSWELRLRDDTPQEIRRALTYFGHVVMMPGQFDPGQYGDNLLGQAQYIGVFRGRGYRDDLLMRGSGLIFWLGDEDDKGDIHETAVSLNGATFGQSVTALLPPGGGVAAGTIHSVPGTYTGKHQWVTPRKALTYVTDTFGAEFRLRGDPTQKVVLDAGTIAQLYVTTPTALIVSKDYGQDMFQVALPGRAQLEDHVEDLTTRVVLLAEGEGDAITTGNADAPATPFKNLRGQPVKLTRLISESETSSTNATARAQLQLNRFTGSSKSVNLSTFDYDVQGQFVVGDYINVYDPDNGFYDLTREVYWKGQPINPVMLRCVEMTYPISPGWTIGFRDIDGNWFDLSPWYVPESGETQIVVGSLSRSLTGLGAEPVGVRPNLPTGDAVPDGTIPAAPVISGTSAGVYEAQDRTLAAVQLEWNQPLNTDDSTITDGDHYEIRYRPTSIVGTRVSWDHLSGRYNVDGVDDFDTAHGFGWGSAWTVLANAAEMSVADGVASVVHPTFGIIRGGLWDGVTASNMEVVSASRIDYAPAGASTVLGTLLRYIDGNNYYWVRVEPNPDQTVTLKIMQRKAGTFTELYARKLPGMVHTPGAEYWLRTSIFGDVISAKVWKGSSAQEPLEDTVSVWDSNPVTGSGRAGLSDYLVSGATNPANSPTRHPFFQVRNLAPDNPADAYSWDDLGTWDRPVSEPIVVSNAWSTTSIPWDTRVTILTDLGAGVRYEFQIRAVDRTPHYGPWSSSLLVDTVGDVIAPEQPAPPTEVAASMIGIQLTHSLGKASGGSFNLPLDLARLEVHCSSDPTFYPSRETKVGEMTATGAMVTGGIPAVGSFKVDQAETVWVRVVAVDRNGNASSPSEAVQSTVELIDDAHISDLTVTKVTAGTITAQWIMAGSIRTATSGARVEMTSAGIRAYNKSGQQTVGINSSDGSASFTGVLQTALNGVGINFNNLGPYSISYWSINDSNGRPSDHRFRQLAWDLADVFGHTMEMSIRTRDGDDIDGAKVQMTEHVLILSHHRNELGKPEAFITLGGWPANPGNDYGFVYGRGKMPNSFMQDGECLWWTRREAVGAGFSGANLLYGPTTVDFINLNVTVQSGAAVSYWVNNETATGFLVSWSDANAHRVYIWAVRQDAV